MSLVLDYAWHGPISPAKFKAAGAVGVMRYLSHTPAKNLSLSEAKLLSDAGLAVGVVWETTATRALDGYGAGVTDAGYAAAQARACGMPQGRPIYFAVDDDVAGSSVHGYFQGVASVLGNGRTGVYGSYAVVGYLLSHGTVKWAWQTYAWSGGLRDPRAQLYQFSNGHTVSGIDTDLNRSYASDYGQWRVGVAPQNGPLPAAPLNQPGEKHNDQWRKPKHPDTPLHYANGDPTNAVLKQAEMFWPDHPGTIQLDFKERTQANGKHYVFARGGYMPSHEPKEYGHVWVDDLAEPLGDPVPPGGGRGAKAPLAQQLVTLTVQPIPDEMGYKADRNSKWANYGDAGAKYGRPGLYSYMIWSSPRVEEGYEGPLQPTNGGGGLVRALVPDGGHLELCDVQRLHCASLNGTGARNGTVVLAYCERSGLYGWVVVAHQYQDGPLVHHIV